MREETQKKLCEMLEVAQDEAFKEMVFSAEARRFADFWTAFENMTKLVDLEQKVCKTEITE
jgi:hypothetical protein